MIGILVALFPTLLNALYPAAHPTWASYEMADTYFPIAGSVLDSFETFMLLTILFMLLMVSFDRWTDGWTRAKIPLTVALIVAGVALTGLNSIENIQEWLIKGISTGIVLFIFYYFVFQYDLSIIPIASASVIILSLFSQSLYNEFPGARIGSLLAIIPVALFSYYWTRSLTK